MLLPMCCAVVRRSSGSLVVPISSFQVPAVIGLAIVSVAFGCWETSTLLVLLRTVFTLAPASVLVNFTVNGPPDEPVTATLPFRAPIVFRFACTAAAVVLAPTASGTLALTPLYDNCVVPLVVPDGRLNFSVSSSEYVIDDGSVIAPLVASISR